MLYSQQGFVDRSGFTDELGNLIGENVDTKFNYDYFCLPLEFGYTFGHNLKITPKIGIQPSLILNAKTVIPKLDSNGNLIGEITFDIKDVVSKFDLAGLLKIELGYRINQHIDVFTSVSGKFSMTKLSNRVYFEQSKLRHRSLTFSLGLKYKMTRG